MTVKTKPPKLSATTEHLSELIREIQDSSRLSSWNELCEDIKLIDNGLALAFMTNRFELARLAKPRALTQEECGHLYHAIAVLLETNRLLQMHAESIGQLVENWAGHFKGLIKAGREIEAFANFEQLPHYEDEK